MHCLWLAWRLSVGFFGLGVAKCLASVPGMYHCLYGSGFWNSKTGEEGLQSRPISPWADSYRDAPLRWAEAKDSLASNHVFPGGSAWLEHKFLEVLGLTLFSA